MVVCGSAKADREVYSAYGAGLWLRSCRLTTSHGLRISLTVRLNQQRRRAVGYIDIDFKSASPRELHCHVAAGELEEESVNCCPGPNHFLGTFSNAIDESWADDFRVIHDARVQHQEGQKS